MDQKLTDAQKSFLLFYVRPTVPCFMPKGDDGEAFRLPVHYYDTYYERALKLSSSVGTTSSAATDSGGARFISVPNITLPDLSLPMQLPRNGTFSIFLPKHRSMASRLIEIFMGMKNIEELLAVCTYCQLHVNPLLFIYCLTIAILHRPDTKKIYDYIPTFAETFPNMFIERASVQHGRELSFVVPADISTPLIIDVAKPNPRYPEQRVAYFREDIGINSHHWHWHLIYPGFGEKTSVDKDRRGELFYYMHHQIMARYNTERLCNLLELVKPLNDFHETITDGVFPKMDSSNASRVWAIRFDEIKLKSVARPDDDAFITIKEMEILRQRIMEAINNMAVQNVNGGKPVPLDEETGIDILGNLVESTELSINKDYYGSYHNQGHNLISLVHDPIGYHSEPSTVMGDVATAMRDPIFYRWHAHINEIFTTFKEKLTPYKPEQLAFPGITVTKIGTRGEHTAEITNTFSTLWQRSLMNLKNGLDFQRERPIYLRLTYLQHEEFNYVIEVNNDTGKLQVGTFRIFMAPIKDEKQVQLSFDQQRQLMIEMDKFSYTLQPGKNTINRESTESSVTVPHERIMRGEAKPSATNEDCNKNKYYCDCGWPQNMLLPKGHEQGYPVVLFVMVSNWNEDKVDQENTGTDNSNASYCGLRDRKYPDRRAMGFPFDRRAGAAALPDFLLPNMAVQNCTINFTNIVVNKTRKL